MRRRTVRSGRRRSAEKPHGRNISPRPLICVMPGLVPGIYVFKLCVLWGTPA